MGVDGLELAGQLRALPGLAGISGPVDQVTALLPELPPVLDRTELRLFRLTTLVAPTAVTGSPRRASDQDQEVLEAWVAAFHAEAHIGPVYTPVEYRGRGYGSAVTAAATQDVLNDGAVPVLFTDLANATSNHIYQELGYVRVEDRVELHLA